MSRFLGIILLTSAIALLAHAFFLVNSSEDTLFKDAAAVSVAISQFDILFGTSASSTPTSKEHSTTAKMSKYLVYGEVIGALVLGAIGIAMITKSALKTAQRVQVNATAPHTSFDSVVFSGNDFSSFNHRGRRMGRVIDHSR